MKKSLILFMTMALAAALFSTVMAAPKSGGQVIIGEIGDNETLNPILSENSSETEVEQCIFSCLYRTDQDTDFVPDLVVAMPTQKGLTYSYTLRKGVLFSDGHELTSEDVKFTWECWMNPNIAVPSRDGWDKIKSFTIPTVTVNNKKVPDNYHFTITLKEVYARYDLLWANTFIVPAHIIKKEMAANGGKLEKGGPFSRNPVGSGPFMLKEWKTDQYTLLVKNPKYFRQGQPYLNQIIFKVVPDTNVMLNQLRTGEIDECQIQPPTYTQALRIPGVKVYKNPAYIYAYIMLNNNDPKDLSKPHPILSDVRVRQALDYAYPREIIVDKVLDGLGYAAYSYLPPISWAYNKNVGVPHFDPEKAKSVLTEAGWVDADNDGIREKNGQKLQLTINTNAGNKTRESIEQICQEYWKNVGVDLIIKNVDPNTLFGDIMENRTFDLLLAGWVSDADPDGNTLFGIDQIPSKTNQQGQNYMGYRNEELDKLMKDGLATFDQAKRKALYLKAQEIIAREVPYIYCYFYVKLNAAREGFENFKANPTTATDLWNCYEWYRTR